MESKRIHMVGVGGIGMSALAQYYLAQGYIVTGSDREESPTTHMLREKGVGYVVIGHMASSVPEDVDLLVYSDAVPENNAERAHAVKHAIPQLNYFEALGKAVEGKKVVAVAGTNGKTTTTAMLGKILIDAGADPTVVVGSIVPEWGSNFRAGASNIFVVEACEYRKHFLVFHPEVLVVTNVEWDHTDFFKTPEEFEAAFAEARSQAKMVVDEKKYKTESVPELLIPGEFNKNNARAAKAAARAIYPKLSDLGANKSLAVFNGTWRRFEHKGTLRGGAELYDDYAHHPTAIQKTIEATRQKYAGKKIVVFFHPHLYSRTRDLFAEFAKALATADEVYILPVYAAREPFDPTATHDELAKAVNGAGGHAVGISGIEETTQKLNTFGADTIVFTMGAGDVYKAGDAALK